MPQVSAAPGDVDFLPCSSLGLQVLVLEDRTLPPKSPLGPLAVGAR